MIDNNKDSYVCLQLSKDNNKNRVFAYYFENVDKLQEAITDSTFHSNDINNVINVLNKHVYVLKIEYKILNDEFAVDMFVYTLKDNILTFPLIERKYEPYGYATPGGFVELDEPSWIAANRELKEELNLGVRFSQDELLASWLGKDENGILFDPRGSVSTDLYVTRVDSFKNIKCGDDAKGYVLLNINLKNPVNLDNIKFATERHKLMVLQAIESIQNIK